MKGIIKLFPAALAMLALASCSNDDFLGSENASGKLQLEATVEAPNSDDGATRAAFLFTSSAQKSQWQENDVFRVYDAALQKYDEFKRDGSVIAVQGTPVVDEHSKAIFPGNQVYYAGYDKKNNDVIAIMDVPSAVTYGGPMIVSDGTVYYVSNMPMWGDVTNPDVNKLQVELKTLSAFTDIAVYQKSVKYIRVLALNEKNAADVALNSDATVIDGGTGTLANMSTDDLVTLDKNTTNGGIFATNTPLAGFFEAQLKPNGVLKANTTNPVLKDSYKSYIEVDLSENTADEAHIYVPIIAGVKYKNLTIQTSTNGTSWTTLKRYAKDSQFDRNGALRKDLVCGKAPITAVVSSLQDLEDKLSTIATTASYRNRTVNITATGDIKTTQEKSTLVIPDLTENQIVNFNFPIDDTDNPLTITGGSTSGKTMTINLNQGISGNTAVTINVSGKLVLTGSINSSRGDQYKKLNVTNAQELTLGSSDDFKSFSSNMDIVSASPLVIDAAEGTIDKVELSAGTLEVKSGTVTTVTSASSGKITINGGKVTTINKTATGGDVEINDGEVTTLEAKTDASTFATDINGGKVTDLKLAKSSGTVTIDDATVTTLDTKAATIGITSTDADATVGTLKLNANATVTLTGDTGDNAKTAKIGTLNANNKIATVSSTGKAVISTASSLKSGSTFTSDWNDTKIATSDITSGKIYTAAQLAGIQANTNYTLQTNVTIATGKAWTPVNLSGNFTAAGKTITGLNAPLFNKISGGVIGGSYSDGTVTPLTLSGVAISLKSGNLGALAKEVDGTATLQNIYVDGSVASTAAENQTNIGGLVGTAKGNVTLLNVVIGSTAAVNIKGYKNVGGYIGSFGAGTLNIQISKILGTKSQIALTYLGKSTTPAAADAGTFGNFIGSVTGAANISVSNLTTTEATDIYSYFTTMAITDATSRNAVKYDQNKNASGKAFIGMQGTIYELTGLTLTYEIGRSTGSISNLTLYNNTKDELGNPFTLTIDHINQYAE